MNYPALLRQPNWVLQSASADRDAPLSEKPNSEALKAWEFIQHGWIAHHAGELATAERYWVEAMEQHPSDLLLQRAINQIAPHLLKVKSQTRRASRFGHKIAIVIPGELRCLKQSQDFFKSLSRHADLFICTSEKFAPAAHTLKANISVVEQEPTFTTGAMQQWHKLYKALRMVRLAEQQKQILYTHILKLRTDYHHVDPINLLKDLVKSDGLICASDKVFGGSRDLMMLFEGFYSAIASRFDQREQYYWPINAFQILHSDDSAKWYGMAFPKTLVGEQKSVESLRDELKKGGTQLANELLRWIPNTSISTYDYVRFFKGHPRFASEICFARFLNFNAIPHHSCPSLTGFLRSDRLTS